MIDAVLTLATEYDMLPSGGLVLCAVSGGADSMCMLHLLHTLAPSAGFSVAAAHYNHGLRGKDSDGDESFVSVFCQDHEIPLFPGRGDAAAAAAGSGQGPEASARKLRYSFLEQTAQQQGAARIATAHTADDNLETVLLNLTRGTGLTGLCGIPPRRGSIVRPLLTVSRQQVEEYLLKHGIAHREDASNQDLRYTRNRIRHQIVPVLRSINPGLSETSARMISALRADNDVLNARAYQIIPTAEDAWGGLMLEAVQLAKLPAALGARAIRLLLDRLDGAGRRDVTAAHVQAVLSLSSCEDPSARVNLPNGIEVRRVYGSLLFTVGSPCAPPIDPAPLSLDGETVLPEAGWRIVCRPAEPGDNASLPPNVFRIRRGTLCGVPVIRSRKTGDRIQIPGRGSRSLKRLFIDEKVPCFLRENVPVLADENGVIAVCGFGADAARAACAGEDALLVSFHRLPCSQAE